MSVTLEYEYTSAPTEEIWIPKAEFEIIILFDSYFLENSKNIFFNYGESVAIRNILEVFRR